MRRDFPSRHIIVLTTLCLANLNIADDYAQAPFEVASAGPILSTFATDSTVLDTLPANDQVIVAGGAQQQIQEEKKRQSTSNMDPRGARRLWQGCARAIKSEDSRRGMG